MNFLISFTWNHATLSEYFKALSKELVQRGHKVIIITDRQRHDLITYGNPSILTWPSFRPVNFPDFSYAYNILRDNNINCIIANFSSVNILTIAGYLRKVPVRAVYYHTLPYCATPTRRNFRKKLLEIRKRIIYALSTHIISVSRAGKEDLIKTFKVNKDKIFIRPYSIYDLYKKHNSQDEKYYDVISVAALMPHKGIDILIKAIYILSKKLPHIKVIIVGGGEYASVYKSMVEELGLRANITFTGQIRGDKVIEYMLRAKILVLPSRSDNYPAVLLEASSCGIPSIGTNVGGIPEIIKHNETGFIVPPDDPVSLSEKIITLLTNREIYERFKINTRKSFEKNHNLEKKIIEDADFWINLTKRART